MMRLPKFLYPPAWPLVVKICLMLLTVTMVPLSLTTFYNLNQSLTVLKKNEYRRLEMLAASTANRLNELIQGMELVSVQLSTRSEVVSFLAAETPEGRDSQKTAVQATLRNIQDNFPVRSVFLLDRNGINRATSLSRNLGENNSFRGFFKEAMRGKVYVSSMLLDARSRQPNIFFAAPVKDDGGNVVGVAVLVFKGERVWEILDEVQAGSDGFTVLIDRVGVVIAHPNKAFLYHSLIPLSADDLRQVQRDNDFGIAQVDSLNLPNLAKAVIGTKQVGHTEYISSNVWKILGYAPLKREPEWVVGVAYEKPQLQAPIYQLVRHNILTGVVIGGITLAVSLLLARGIVRPIHRLTKVAQDLKQDRLNPQELQKLPRGEDDVGQLVEVFISMAEDVRVREHGLKQQVNELHNQIEVVRQESSSTGDLAYFRHLRQKVQALRRAHLPGRSSEGTRG
ncbi:hypothetical protein BST81_01720 [Leptolyngbya sp. 'hensonii']|uniref:cache domain-containing protein n=1 Tax=Leptolyngbya sp. 'hensonii' TaxID=1922337 RepID=UPI00094FA655|nr:cache domain-containing protein [Leptolyngbya sp. 'hensonii']OLP20175.1 hypothetical protein BST81_01720 [Leptolyngbya sp. 'hensonii']